MKKTLSFALILFLFLPLLAQNNPLADVEGMRYETNYFFEIDGHRVSKIEEHLTFNDKNIESLKKILKINKKVEETSSTSLPVENRIIEYKVPSAKNKNVSTYSKTYFLKNEGNNITRLSIHSYFPIKSEIERIYLDAYFADEIAPFCSDVRIPDSINFVGRRIELENKRLCQRISPNNIQCYNNNGQMSWSSFDNSKEAKSLLDIYITENSKIKEVSSKAVNVIFEGMPIMAKRIVYKTANAAQKLLIGNKVPDKLAVYYVTTQVRGKNTTAMLSHYIVDEDDYELPYLLSKVMTIDDTKK